MSKQRNYYGVRAFLAGRPRLGRLLMLVVICPILLMYAVAVVIPKRMKPRLYNLAANCWHVLYPMAWWN